MMKLIVFAFALITPFGANTQGSVEPAVLDAVTPAYLDCMDASNGNTASLACNRAELARQEARLNTSYQALLRRLTPAQARWVVANTAQWRVERERDCRTTAARQRAIPNAMAFTQCQFHETIRRRLALRSYSPEN